MCLITNNVNNLLGLEKNVNQSYLVTLVSKIFNLLEIAVCKGKNPSLEIMHNWKSYEHFISEKIRVRVLG